MFEDAYIESQGLKSFNYDGPEGIKKLSLYNNKLSCLPSNLAKLKKLQRINLSVNEFTRIPPGVFSLRALEVLDIKHNKIEKINDEISNFAELKFS